MVSTITIDIINTDPDSPICDPNDPAYNWDPSCSSYDPSISIDVEYPFTPVTPGFALLFGELTLHADSQMLIAPIAKP